MPKKNNRDRILNLLYENESMSSFQIKSKLNLTDKNYHQLKEDLIAKKAVKKYRCKGGGIKLTKRGETEFAKKYKLHIVKTEKELYEPFIGSLEKEIEENEECAIIVKTSSFKKRGKWANPDVIKISYRLYPIQRTERIFLTTYELKPFKSKDTSSAYEAASHSTFSHESHVVIEWPKVENEEGLENMESICRNHGIGLMLLESHYGSFRHKSVLDADTREQVLERVEEYLDYVFERVPDQEKELNKMIKEYKAKNK